MEALLYWKKIGMFTRKPQCYHQEIVYTHHIGYKFCRFRCFRRAEGFVDFGNLSDHLPTEVGTQVVVSLPSTRVLKE